MRRILRNTPERKKESDQSKNVGNVSLSKIQSTNTGSCSSSRKHKRTIESPKSPFDDNREIRNVTKILPSLVSNNAIINSPNIDTRSLGTTISSRIEKASTSRIDMNAVLTISEGELSVKKCKMKSPRVLGDQCSERITNTMKAESPLATTSTLKNIQTRIKNEADTTPKTPESQQKRELRNLEDYWAIQESPDVERKHNLRSGNKLENQLLKKELSLTESVGSTNARRKITFSDVEENIAHINIDVDEYQIPRKKLRSQVNPSELWEGLSNQRATRFFKKPKFDDPANNVLDEATSGLAGILSNKKCQSVETNVGTTRQNTFESPSFVSSLVPKVERNSETDEEICSSFDKTVNYSNLKICLVDNNEKAKYRSEQKRIPTEMCDADINYALPGDEETTVNAALPISDNQLLPGYTVLQAKSEDEDITMFKYSREPPHMNLTAGCDTNTGDRNGPFLSHARCTHVDTMPLRTLNKVIVTNPFASYSDTQIYVSILNRQDLRENMQTKAANSNQQCHRLTSRSEEDTRHKNITSGNGISRNDKMVSLLKDIKVISAKMSEKSNKTLSCLSGNSSVESGSHESQRLVSNEDTTHFSTRTDRDEISHGSSINISENVMDIRDHNSNLQDFALYKDVSDNEFGSVSEFMITRCHSFECAETTTGSENKITTKNTSNTEMDSSSQASMISENASTTILIAKIDSILASEPTNIQKEQYDMPYSKVNTTNNILIQDTFNKESSKECSSIGTDEFTGESAFARFSTTNDNFESDEVHRDISTNNLDGFTSSSRVRLTQSHLNDTPHTYNVITPKRSARLQEKRTNTPKQDGSFFYTPIRKHDVDDNINNAGLSISKTVSKQTNPNQPDTQTPKQKSKSATAEESTLNHDGHYKKIEMNSRLKSPYEQKSFSKSKNSTKTTANLKPGRNNDTTCNTNVSKRKSGILQTNIYQVSQPVTTGTSPKIKMKIKRMSDGAILAQTIIDGTASTVSTSDLSSKGIAVRQNNSVTSLEHSVTSNSNIVQEQNRPEKWKVEPAKSSDSASDEGDEIPNSHTIREFREAYEKHSMVIKNTSNVEKRKRKYKKKSTKSKKKKKSVANLASCYIKSEESSDNSSSKKMKQKSQTQYDKGNTKNNAESAESSQFNPPSSRSRGPVEQDELLRNHLVGQHACILWSSEHRRHFQQTNSDADASEVEDRMREAWEVINLKEKLRYYQRAKNAMKDENKHSMKKKTEKQGKETLLQGDDARAATFMKLPTSFQYSQLRKWLRFFHEVSPGDYTTFIEDFKKTLKSEKSSIRESSECDEGIDLQSRYRKLLFEKISDAKEKFRELYDMKKEKQIEMLKDHYHVMIRRLIKGDEIEFLKDFRSDGLSEILTDLRSLENDMMISVSGTPMASNSYSTLLEKLKNTPDGDNSDADNDVSTTPTSQAMDCILSQVTEDNFPVMDASFVDSILENGSESSTTVEERIAQEQVELEVSDLLVEFFEKEANQAYHRWQSNDLQQNCCDLKSPSCILSDLVVAEHLKQPRSPLVQQNQISEILRRSNHLGPISLAAGGFNIITVPHNPRYSFRARTSKINSNEKSPCNNDACRPIRSDILAQRFRMTNKIAMGASQIVEGGLTADNSTNIDDSGTRPSTELVMTSLLNNDNPSLKYAKVQSRYGNVTSYRGPGRLANKTYTIGLSTSDRHDYQQSGYLFARPLRTEFKEKFSINKYNMRSKPAIVRRDPSSSMQPENVIDDQETSYNNVDQHNPVLELKQNVLRQSYSDMDVRNADTMSMGIPVISQSKPDMHNPDEKLSDLGIYTPVFRSGNTRGPFIYATGRSEDIQMAKRYQQFLNEKNIE